MNDFVNIPNTIDNIDRYIVRTSIFKALNLSLPFFKGNLLDIGCGKMPYKNYILNNSKVENYTGLDIDTAIDYKGEKPDFFWDGLKMPFQNNSFDTILLTEVLEHCPDPEIVLAEAYRVLRPGGVLFFTVPFLWPLHEVPHDEYRFTPWSLEKHFKKTNFIKIDIRALGGWHLSMAQMLGLWVARAPMKNFSRKILRRLIFFIIKNLIKKSKNEIVNFKESQMITGLYGIVTKDI